MTWKHWVVVASFLLGWIHPIFFLVSVLVFEFGIRRGSITMALWAEQHLHSRHGGGGGSNE